MKDSKTRILHLEDSSLDAELIHAALRGGGIDAEIVRVETRTEFEEALQGTFDLILADYALPSFDGLSALQMVQRLQLDVPFIFVSGILGEETAIETLKSGATDYVLKQRLARLVPSVRRALREARERGGRRLAERALRTSEERFRIALKHSPITVFHQDRDLRYTWVHNAHPALAADRLIGQRDFDVFDPKAAEHLTQLKRRVLETGAGVREEVELLIDGSGDHADRAASLPAAGALNGTPRTYDLTIEPLRDAEGTIIGLTAAAVDITERRVARRRLIAEHAVTRILAEASDLQIAAPGILQAISTSLDCELGQWWEIDWAANVLRCRQSWSRLPNELEEFREISRNSVFASGIGLPGRVWLHRRPDWIADVTTDPNFPRASFASAARLRTGVAFPILVGDEFFGVMEFFARRTFEPDRSLMEMMAAVGSEIGQFIQRKQAEQALRASEERYRFLAEAIPQFVWTAQPDGAVDYCNRRWFEYTGLTMEQTAGLGWTSVLHPDDRQRTLGRWELAAESGQYYEMEYRFRRASDGAYRWHLGRVLPIRDDNGRVVKLLGTAADIDARKQAVESLRESQERLNLALRAARMGTWTNELATGKVTWSAELEAIFGLPPGGFGGTERDFFELIHPDDRERVAHTVARALESASEYEAEFRFITPDGAVHWMAARGQSFFENGKAVRLAGIGMDVTERRAAEEKILNLYQELALRVSELQTLLDVIPVGIAIAEDAACQRITITPRFAQMMGLSEGVERGADGLWLDERIPFRILQEGTEVPPSQMPMQLAAARGVEIRDWEAEIRLEDGRRFDVLGNAAPFFDEQHRVRGCVAAFLDITHRKRAEHALRTSEEQYRFLAESIPEIVWTAAPDGQVDYFNRRWYEYGGLQPEESLGSGWQSIVHPDDLPGCRAAWESALQSGEPYEIEYRLRQAFDGAYRWHLGRAAPMRAATGEGDSPIATQRPPIIKWFGTCTDVDDQRRAAEALRKSRARLRALVDELARSNKELDDFAYIASHDLKEPLRGIHNYAAFLLEDYAEKLDGDGRTKIETLIRLSQRMDSLIDSLLEYSRVGRVAPEVSETDLNEVVAEVLDSLHITIQQRGVELRVPRLLPTIRCDRVYVAEVFRNLITNAMKYNDKPQKWIEIGYDDVRAAGGAGHVFYVRDNGIGIRLEHKESVFRMFRRLHGRDEFGGGTGSGLTICKKIIERHGGRIWFESAYGEGSTFYFTLEEHRYAGAQAVHPVG